MKLVGERRALAVAVFAFFALLYFLQAFMAEPELKPALYALFGCYFLAFFSLVAGYFWARWYATGLGVFGILVAAVGCWQMGALEPILIFLGGTHLGAAVMLWGESMSESFEGQRAWRDKFHMDDNAVQRLGRSVIRAGVSLPMVLLYGLMPKPESAVLSVVVVGLSLLGFAGIVKLRTWGLLATATAGALVLGTSSMTTIASTISSTGNYVPMWVSPLVLGGLLVATMAPFAGPMRRWVAQR